MSAFGMDTGRPGDAPHLGKIVIYQAEENEFVPAVVTAVREDGWTVSLEVFGQGRRDFVPFGGDKELGVIDLNSWVTQEEYEGWKIYQQERSVKDGEGESRDAG